MDVALLSTMISELITDHDMVGLPGLGTFVAEVVPATFSDKGYTINPPYRRLSFHPSRSEDTLLIDFYAASNGISKEAAALYLKQFLSEMKTVLKERKTISLPGLGRLRATVENNFFFVPDPDLDIYPDGFGLEPLSLKAMIEPEPVEIPIVPSSPETVSATVAETAPETAATPAAEEIPALETNSALASDAETANAPAPETETAATPAAEEVPASETNPAPAPETETAATPAPEATPTVGAEPATAATAVLTSTATATATLPIEAPAVRTGLKSCAPDAISRTAQPETGVPCAPGGILRTEVPLVRTAAEFSAPGYGEHGNDGGPLVRTAAESESAPESGTNTGAEPEPDPQPQPVTELEPTPETRPQPAAEPQPQPQPQPKPQLQSRSQLQNQPQPAAVPQPRQASPRRFRWWIPVLVLLAVAAVALLAFLTVAQVAPDFIDSILYTPEELRIINY